MTGGGNRGILPLDLEPVLAAYFLDIGVLPLRITVNGRVISVCACEEFDDSCTAHNSFARVNGTLS